MGLVIVLGLLFVYPVLAFGTVLWWIWWRENRRPGSTHD